MSWVKMFSIYCFEICWFAFYSCDYTYYCCRILISFSCIKISFFSFILKIFKTWKSRGWKLATFILVFKKIPVMEIFYGSSWLCNESQDSQLDSWFCDFFFFWSKVLWFLKREKSGLLQWFRVLRCWLSSTRKR